VAGAVAGAEEPVPVPAHQPAGRPVAEAAPATQSPPRIDLNSASLAELKTLPGIGNREARKIIAGRPWVTKIDLVMKGVLPQGRYVALKNRIVVLKPGIPPAGK
jgi:DNA uptake protein ComE-like DNA-binding protein